MSMFAPVERRHLAFHILPISGNGIWQRAVDQLRLRWGLFNGSKVVTIATGIEAKEQWTGRMVDIDPPEKVREYLPPDCEVIEVPNDPNLWELAAWPKLWPKVLKQAHANDAVLYCHAKGVTRPIDSPSHRWTIILWKLVLDYWNEVAEHLEQYPITGPLKKTGKYGTKTGVGTGKADWHYSGNFWWVRCGSINHKLRTVLPPSDPWGAEAYPGIAYKPEEAGALIEVDNNMNFYKTPHMNWLEKEFAYWADTRKPTPIPTDTVIPQPVQDTTISRPVQIRGDFPTLSIIIPTIGRETLSRAIESVRPQLRHGDEILILRDESGNAGHTARNTIMPQARGDYLAFLDDDNVYAADALDTIRKTIVKNPKRPLIFRIYREPYDDVIPNRGVKTIREGQVDTGGIVVPNDSAKLGTWAERRCGDWDFARSTIALYRPQKPLICDEIIMTWRAREESVTRDWNDIPGMFDYADLYDQQIARIKPNTKAKFVEVGVWMGRSLAYLTSSVLYSKKRIDVYGVDTWKAIPGNDGMERIASLEKHDGRPLWERFKRNMKDCGLEKFINVLRSDSAEAAKQFADRSLDFVFIDASHTEQKVIGDIEAWLPKLKTGGVLAGHDYDTAAVQKAVGKVLGRHAKPCSIKCWKYDIQA